ncbi:MAG: nucleotidyltransferase family protein [Clostridia bacterium]|nr:nucleotidyltransferase family protein [Clostridia bacterium]
MTYEEKVKTARYLARVFFEFESGLPISEKPEELLWSWVYGMAKKHSLTALIFEALQKRVREEAPEALYQDFNRDSAIAGAKHISQKAELENISRLFSENEIPFMPLKGFLIKALYKNPALREMTDIDIFVGRENFEKAAGIIKGLGYQLELSLEVHDSFKKPPFLEIELHKILHPDISGYTMESSLPSENNPYHRFMTEEDFLVFLLHHAKKHDETGGAGIRTVFDFYLIFKNKEYDEAKLLARLEKENLADFYKRLKSLIDFWFFGGESSPALFDFEIYTVTGGTYGNLENAYLRKGRKKGRIALLFERLFPPYSLISARYPILKKCPILLPVFYLVRIISSLFDGSAKKNIKAAKGASKKKKELDMLSKENTDKS